MKKILAAMFNRLALGLLALSAPAAQPAAVPASLPLYFEANGGQIPVPAPFIARGHDYLFLISPAEAQIVLRKNAAGPESVQMQFVGASARARISGDDGLPGKINYLTGNDPAQWRTGVATFARVRVGELYPGINLVYYGNQQQLEYDFAIAPGANPDAIAIHFEGADTISVTPRGELMLNLAGGEILQPKPVIYQTVGGARKEIEGGYRLVDAHTIAFAVGKYDRSQPLVIDPILSYSTYFGGTASEIAFGVAVDTNGFVYIAGQTLSQKFHANETGGFSTTNAFQKNFQGGTLTGDAFVAKFDNLGRSLIYLTYLGGSADDGAFGVAVDAAGDAYVTGFTDSPNYPTTTNALYKKISGTYHQSAGAYPVDAFVTELNTNGSSLIYSTYLGGSGMDGGMGIAVDATDNAYVTGFTYSSDFPTTNAFQKKLACTNSFYFNANAFLAKIGPGGSPLVYSTYFGGTNFDEGEGVAVDNTGAAYVTGFTVSTNFPTANFVHQMIGSNLVDGHLLNGSVKKTITYDAFVAKFDPTGTNLVYSTYLGGTNNDEAAHIAVDTNGAAYVTGWTVSTNFPQTVTVTNLHTGITNNLHSIITTNVFLTKITNSADSVTGTNAGIAWSLLFGGNRVDVGQGVAVDPAGNVFVVGSTSSTNFPCYPTNAINNLRSTNSGKSDVFVTALSSTLSSNTPSLLYSIRLGGKDSDFGYGIAVDPLGNAYIVGQTSSTNFPTLNTTNTFRNGPNDAFLAKILLTLPPVPPLAITSSGGSPNTTITVSWPADLPFYPELPQFFKLESVTDLLSTNWFLQPAPILTNGLYVITGPPPAPVLFFRLHQF